MDLLPQAILQKRKQQDEQEIILRLLENVANDREVSQAQFAGHIGIAKGLANAYFNRCLKKGWIKLSHVPRRRYLYYLTPKGFAEKARLSAQFLTYSYCFYRDARADLVATMQEAASNGHSRILVLGAGELAEIAAIVSGECSVEIVGFISKEHPRDEIAGRPVGRCWNDFKDGDGALLATIDDAKEVHEAFRRTTPHVPLHVPKQLIALVQD